MNNKLKEFLDTVKENEPVAITPEIAAELLKLYDPEDNRPINPRIYAKYMAQMQDGAWALKEEAPIVIDRKYLRVLDGFHRLYAFARSKTKELKTYIHFFAPKK